MLWKGVYLYEYMGSRERFNETSLAAKIEFFSDSAMKDITDTDNKHVKIVCEDVGIQNIGQYNDLYVQIDTLLLADVFGSFRNKCKRMYEVDLA